MATKKKPIEALPCPHCSKTFLVTVRWCGHCEGHVGLQGWMTGHDVCDRCASGKNEWYLKRRGGREERVAKFLADANDPSKWKHSGLVEAYGRREL